MTLAKRCAMLAGWLAGWLLVKAKSNRYVFVRNNRKSLGPIMTNTGTIDCRAARQPRDCPGPRNITSLTILSSLTWRSLRRLKDFSSLKSSCLRTEPSIEVSKIRFSGFPHMPEDPLKAISILVDSCHSQFMKDFLFQSI